MSQHHRKELIEQGFAQAEREVDGMILAGPRWARVFGQAGKAISRKAEFNDGFDFRDYTNGVGFPDTAVEWAMKNSQAVQQNPTQAMSDWIDTFPRARTAVDAYCASQAKQDLVFIANMSRADNLASPEEALGRRNRGRAM